MLNFISNIPKCLQDLEHWFPAAEDKTPLKCVINNNGLGFCLDSKGIVSCADPTDINDGHSFNDVIDFIKKMNNGEYKKYKKGKDRTWFEDTFKLCDQGIGFVLAKDRKYTAIDFDHCIDDEGKIDDDVLEWIGKFGSYTEFSQSGHGFHIFVEGCVPDNCGKSKYSKVEIYSCKHYILMTGNVFQDLNIVHKNQSLLTEFYEFELAKRQKAASEDTKNKTNRKPEKKTVAFPSNIHSSVTQVTATKSDMEIINLITSGNATGNKKRDKDLKELFENTSAKFPDNSTGDLSLCDGLAEITGGDYDQIDRIMRMSRRENMVNGKWDAVHVEGKTYGEATITKALEFYSIRNNDTSGKEIFSLVARTPAVDELPSYILPARFIINDNKLFKVVVNPDGTNVTNVHVSDTIFIIAGIRKDIETGEELADIAYFNQHRKCWEMINEVHVSELFDSSKIVALSNLGLDITSLNKTDIVAYISQFKRINIELIPVTRSVTHMGWLDDKFIPYDQEISIATDRGISDVASTVSEKGSASQWCKAVLPLVEQSIILRIMIATALASVLLRKIGAQIFWCHVWGNTGIAKTIALRIVASIFGVPDLYRGYIVTLNCTTNYLSKICGDLCNMPLLADELQTIKRKKGENYDDIVMQLCEGIERGRQNKSGNTQRKSYWCNTITTTGEEPIVMSNSGGGVANRVIEIDARDKIIPPEQVSEVLNIVTANYGVIGRMYVDYVRQNSDYDNLRGKLEAHRAGLVSHGISDKQCANGAMVLLADEIFCSMIGEYANIQPMSEYELIPYLKNRKEVSKSARAEEFIDSLIAANSEKFDDNCNGERWGKFEKTDGKNKAYFNKFILERELRKEGIELKAIINDLSKTGYIDRPTTTRGCYFSNCIGGIKTPTAHINLKD